jgi:hypothetical protein
MSVGTFAVGALGGVMVLATLIDAFEVMLLPRRIRRRRRFVRAYFQASWLAWTAVGRRLKADARGTFLSVYGPLSMIGLFTIWMTSLVVGFGLVHWAVAASASPPGGASSIRTQIYFSGTTFFTLGYGDVTAHTGVGHVLSVLEAGIGLGLIAVVIGYLPVLYQLFSRREAYVIRLDARAGSPPTAAEFLARHAVSAQGVASLGALLGEWEHWAAELLESHLSYPMLAYYRSQHDNESWLAALTTVLDACALLTLGLCDVPHLRRRDAAAGELGLASDLPTFQARMTFATARLAVVEMTHALHSAPAGQDLEGESGRTGGVTESATDEGAPTTIERLPDRLPAIAFERLTARLESVGLTFDEDTEPPHARLDTLRSTYEPFLEALAVRLLLPLPRWVAYDDATDNWQQSVGGEDAKRLIDAAGAADVDAR